MAGVNMHIDGTEILRKQLAALSDKAERKVVRDAGRAAGNLILKAARQKAPASRRKGGGKLKTALAVRVSATNAGESVRVGIQQRKGARHAHLVHDGTKPHTINRRAGKGTRGMGWTGGGHFGRAVQHPGAKAQPFLTDAFEENKAAAIRLYENKLIDAIVEVKQMGKH